MKEITDCAAGIITPSFLTVIVVFNGLFSLYKSMKSGSMYSPSSGTDIISGYNETSNCPPFKPSATAEILSQLILEPLGSYLPKLSF